MSVNARIVQALIELLSGQGLLHSHESGYCLRNVRLVLQRALGLSYDEFWARFRTHTVADNPDPTSRYWARDVMLSLREQGKRVAFDQTGPVIFEELQPGDLYFNWRLAHPVGHCGVLLTGGKDALLLENTSTQRGVKVSGYNRLSRVDEMPYPEAAEVYGDQAG